MNPLKLLNPSYLFDPTPGYFYIYFWPLVILFILIFIGSFFLPTILKGKFKHPNLLSGIPSVLRKFALLGLLFNFFRDQNIPYLAMRAWIVLLLITLIAYFIWTWRKYKKGITLTVIKKVFTETTDKYLPKPKKKRKKKR